MKSAISTPPHAFPLPSPTAQSTRLRFKSKCATRAHKAQARAKTQAKDDAKVELITLPCCLCLPSLSSLSLLTLSLIFFLVAAATLQSYRFLLGF